MHIIKQIYAKTNNVKFALLLLKTTPIANKNVTHEAQANTSFARQLKAHLPILRHHKLLVTCIGNEYASPEVQSKYNKDQSVWIKFSQIRAMK